MTAPRRWSFNWRAPFVAVAILAARPDGRHAIVGHWRPLVPRSPGSGKMT